jgi:DNA-binding MarR family transcriptional regulator
MLALETIIRNPGQEVPDLVSRTGLTTVELQPILDRLVKLDYARAGSQKTGNQYHGVARLNGT